MTQPPPQSPNEPPQGGFGVPQGPPPPGQPPQAPPQGPPPTPPSFAKPAEQPPGYGTPPPPGQPPQSPPPPGQPPTAPIGQPPTAPVGQPGYGYPQAPGAQQPTMAAQPTVVAQPGVQAYGYPGQQQYGGFQGPTAAQPAVAQGGRRVNPQVAIIVSAVVAIVLIIGGGVWYSKSTSGDTKDEANSGQSGGSSGGNKGGASGGPQGGGGKEKVPANTNAKVLLQVPAPEVAKDAVDSVKGSWLYTKGKVYAKAGVNELIGYNTDTGKQAWQLALDGQTCASSPEVSEDGIAAVVYESAKRKNEHDIQPCSMVAAIDLKTGTKVWSEKVVANDQEIRFEEVSISGTIVAAGGGTDDGAAFDLTSGKSLWSPKTGTCEDAGYGGGEQLVAIRRCGSYDKPKFEVQLLGPDGKPKWSYKLPDGVQYPKVLSSKPVVVGAEAGSEISSTGTSDVFSLDDSGKLRTKIAIPDDTYDYHCGATEVHDCHGVAIGNDRLYVPTAEHEGSGDGYGYTNEIISFDLGTGKTTGDRADAGERYKIFPLRMDGSNIIAYKDGPYDKGAQVVSLDSKTMKETTLLETPASRAVLDALSTLVPRSSEIWYSDGRLFIGKELISRSSIAGQRYYTAIGFGS